MLGLRLLEPRKCAARIPGHIILLYYAESEALLPKEPGHIILIYNSHHHTLLC